MSLNPRFTAKERPIMNAKLLIAIASFAAVAAGAARAETEAEYTLSFEGSRTRAEVMAEAAKVAATRSNEPAGSRVAAPVQSTVDAKALRAEAALAVRQGQISYGELGQL
jgi:hypothetical protein